MRKRIAAILILILCVSCCPIDTLANTEIPEEKDGLKQLWIPQKLGVVIDPWEMDGKGQIYSEEFMIRNTGDNPGVLTLSNLSVNTQENSGIIVRSDSAGMHDNQEKSVYMQMQFGEKDTITLSESCVSYQVELQPGEELPICFKGEVNEYASEGWKNGDIKINVTYAWEVAEHDTFIDINDNVRTTDESNTEETVPEEEGTKKDDSIVIGVQDLESSEFTVDSWKLEGNGKIYSAQYTMRNTGEVAGTLSLSELCCKTAEKSGIVVCSEEDEVWEENEIIEEDRIDVDNMEVDKKEDDKPEDEKSKFIHIEMETANGDKLALKEEVSQENPEESEYKAELKKGEELTFRFVGELKGINLEELKERDIIVSAICSWITDSAASE